MNIENMTLEDLEKVLTDLDKEVRNAERSRSLDDAIKFVNEATKTKEAIISRKRDLEDLRSRKQIAQDITNGTVTPDKIIDFRGDVFTNKESVKMTDNIELRAFQKFITEGTRNMNDTEMRALNLSGSASALPISVYDKLITSGDYSDLLRRATIINQENAGKLYVPIASANAATVHTENAAGTEAEPTVTKLELGGYEFVRLVQISSAAASMTNSNFIDLIMELIAAEVIETMEDKFVTGTNPFTGLGALTWGATNQVKTTNAQTPIAAANIAEAMSLLKQKYARNAIVLVNADMAYQMSQFKGTSEYAYSMTDGATRFLGKEICINEHMPDDTVYIVDPKQLYVRFAEPLRVEADRSAGFTTSSIWLRAQAVLDFKWNPAACVMVCLGA